MRLTKRCGLFRLPVDFLCQILLEWMYFEIISHLDSAVCNKNERVLFSQLISEDCFTGRGFHFYPNGNYLNWLRTRQIKVTNVVLKSFSEVANGNSIGILSNLQYLQLITCDLLKRSLVGYLPKLKVLFLSSTGYKSTELLNLLNNCPNLQQLHIGEYSQLKSHSIVSNNINTTEYVRNDSTIMSLVSLHCVNAPVKDSALFKILEHNCGLRSITLDSCDIVTDRTLINIGKMCCNVTYLSVSSCQHMTDEGVVQFSRQCTTLETIVLVNNRQLTQNSILKLTHRNYALKSLTICIENTEQSFILLDFNPHNPLLQTLQLTKCTSLIDNNLEYLVKTCGNLHTIDVSSCVHITDKSVSYLAAIINTRLLSLCVSDCYQLTDNSIGAVAEHCTELTTLDISYCYNITDSAVQEVVCNCIKLTSLNIASCFNLTNSTINNLVDHYAEQIMMADTAHTADTVGTANNDSDGIDVLHNDNNTSTGKMLTYLNISQCDLITGNSVLDLVECCTTLQVLHAKVTKNMNLVVSTALRNCPNLRVLDVEFCDDLTDDAFVFACALGNGQQSTQTSTYNMLTIGRIQFLQLTEINLSHCKLITDETLQNITDSCANLICLNLTACVLLTNQGVFNVGRRCHFLRTLCLTGCGVVVSANSISEIQKMCPMLSIACT